jgi:hypothetical protein
MPDGNGRVVGHTDVVDWPGACIKGPTGVAILPGPSIQEQIGVAGWPGSRIQGRRAAKRDSWVGTAWNGQLIVQNPGRIRADEHGRMARAQKKGVAGWPGPNTQGRNTDCPMARTRYPETDRWPDDPVSKGGTRTGLAGWPGPSIQVSRGGRALPDGQGPVSAGRRAWPDGQGPITGRTGLARWTWPGIVSGADGHQSAETPGGD